MSNSNTQHVSTTKTSFEIIEFLLKTREARTDDISSALNLSSSTVHRHLNTLQDVNYVTKEGEIYRLGFQFLTVGGYLRRQVPGYPLIREKVNMLANETGDRAQFMIREGTDKLYLYTETGESSVQTGAYVGRRGPIQSSAAGKAILANLPEPTRERLIDSIQMERTAKNTITNKDELRENLSLIRERGFALNVEESTDGVNAVGAVVRGLHKEVIGALSVSGPASRLREKQLEEEIPDLLLPATNEIELQIAHSFK